MRMVNIRDLRGPVIEELSESKQLAGVTNNRVLAAIIVPVGEAWVDHLVEANWSRVYQNVAEGTYDRASTSQLVTLEDATLDGTEDSSVPLPPEQDEGSWSDLTGSLSSVRRFARSILRLGDDQDEMAATETPELRTIRIGDLSGAQLSRAGEAGELLAVTNGRKLAAFLIPVTPALVMHLVENNLSRVMSSVLRGQQERHSRRPFETLNDVLPQATARKPQKAG